MVTTTTGIATSYINFSRASNATVTNNVGNIAWAGHNLLLASEQFDASNWVKAANVTITANAGAAPSGTTTADRAATSGASASVTQLFTTVIGEKYKISVWAKSFGGSNQTIRLLADTSILSADLTVTSSWQLFELEFTVATGGSRSFGITAGTAFANYDVLIWGATLYRSDLGGMVYNPAQPAGFGTYYPTTPLNFLGYTEDFNNAYWNKGECSIISNAIVAPNGLQVADLIVENTATGAHGVGSGSSTIVASTPYTWSVYVKAAGRSWAWINAYDGANRRCWFDLANGVTGTVAAGCTATIISVGNGWYRLSVIRASGGATGSIAVYAGTSDNSTSYTGDGTSGIYIWGAQLSDSASIDPYSPVYGAAPTAAAYYAPRLDYSPTTIQPLGLLVEEQRTNLVLNSAAFADASWTKAFAGTGVAPVVTPNFGIAPDGTSSAARIVFDSGVGTTASDLSLVSATTTTAAVNYASSIWLRTLSGTATILIRGAAISSFTALTVTSSWQRFNTVELGVVGTGSRIDVGLRQGLAGIGTINSTATVLAWGAQLEAGSFPTSYIPTTSATVTRSVDVASVSTQAFPYGSTEGTIVVNVDTYDVGATAGLMATLSAGLTSNSIIVGLFSNKTTLSTTVGGVSQAFLQPSGTVSTNTVFKAGGAFATNSFIASSTGTLSTEDTSGSLPTGATTLGIGIISSSLPINGHIRQITYLPRRISNAELQTRTT